MKRFLSLLKRFLLYASVYILSAAGSIALLLALTRDATQSTAPEDYATSLQAAGPEVFIGTVSLLLIAPFITILVILNSKKMTF
ncbi:hypothetical protein G4Y79_24130 [Phototrophicus methaneseepsis]|uniref:Uncharacterized protein n=1 Tax=Phototrophicus methaneseepsis TaxID=2710758 RepID=A0A7S8E995_9CHLR|nr:hypothetical protein [Phototrophicus methaneseepsis]QPC82735.1 hypothetical protein G4Y79_24130 [Phototrophicus methaneseepsis]